MTAGAVRDEDLPAERHSAVAEFSIERRVERLGARQAAGLPEVGGPCSEQEPHDLVEAILDRAEARAIAPALADLERRLAVIALGGIDRAQIGNVVDPALLRARADVEVDPLYGLGIADGVLAALEDIGHLL